MLKIFAPAIVAFGLAACASTQAETSRAQTESPCRAGPPIVIVNSANSFEETLTKAQAGIDARGFKTFAVIDHAKGAASIGETLRPTTLIIFGNPKGGTPLIQTEQLLGLELPLKMLIAEGENGETRIAYRNIAQLFEEYGINDMAAPQAKIAAALGAIAAEAAAQ